MPKIRITDNSPLKIEFTEGDFESETSRTCATIGHPGTRIDWSKTAQHCQVIGNGLEIELVPRQ